MSDFRLNFSGCTRESFLKNMCTHANNALPEPANIIHIKEIKPSGTCTSSFHERQKTTDLQIVIDGDDSQIISHANLASLVRHMTKGTQICSP